MTPILQRIYQSDGGSEVCDTLMKYLYKGMAQGGPATNSATPRNVTPQATGFSQAGGRSFGGGEGGGQAMSVLLSWHEKVRHVPYKRLYERADSVIACRDGWSGQHCARNVGSKDGMKRGAAAAEAQIDGNPLPPTWIREIRPRLRMAAEEDHGTSGCT